jgi:CRISPR-associated endonuclease Cas2
MELDITGFLIAYDVRCPKRLVRLHRFLASRSLAVQYSVFAASGDFRWASTLASDLSGLIEPEDDVRIYSTPKQTYSLLIDANRGAVGVRLAAPALPALLREFLRFDSQSGPILI